MTGPARSPLIISIISVLTAVLISLVVFPALALPDPALERRKSLQDVSGLEEEADRLARELLVLDLKLKKARQDKELAEKELAATRKKKDGAAEEYRRSLEAKNASLKKIGLWVNFHYRYGHWSLVDVILESESLSELAYRSVMAAFILGRQARDYRTASDACTAAGQKEKSLAELENLLILQNRSLEDQIGNIQSLSDRRKEFLAGIKARSRELALQVADLERKFLESLNLVDLLTGALAKFAWYEVKPDRVSVGPGGIRMELSESALNQSLRASGIKELEGFSVKLRPGLFIVNGRDKNSTSTFALEGVLVPSGRSGSVRFEPKTLSLDGVPVAEEVVRELAGSMAIQLAMPLDAFSTPSRIDIYEEKMAVTLAF
ncbi:MAG: hypothetical protein K6T66_08450 [Peptococcaceae bacterium]|nr:hypothetical protein [Peptococcaceae bacterium]